MMNKVFYSFHYENDVMRVQLIRNMGIVDGNQPVSPNEWETVKRSGDAAIKSWIDKNMQDKSCVIVLIGEETYKRKWVHYEIEQAYNKGKALMGIYIHNLNDPNEGTCKKGPNPFQLFRVNGNTLDRFVPCHDPISWDAYNDIRNNIDRWVNEAVMTRVLY